MLAATLPATNSSLCKMLLNMAFEHGSRNVANTLLNGPADSSFNTLIQSMASFMILHMACLNQRQAVPNA